MKKVGPDIASFLWKLTDDPKVLRLLELSLGRVLDNAASEWISVGKEAGMLR